MATFINDIQRQFSPTLAQLPTPPDFAGTLQTFPLSGIPGLGSSQSANNSPGAFKVRLVSVLDMLNGAPGDIKRVIFEVTPTISESQGVEYASVQPIHMPGGIQVYKYTNPRQFEITAHFIARNTKDALDNMKYIQTLRSWSRPFFGKSTTNYAQLPTINGMPSPTDTSAMGIEQIKGGDSTPGVNLLGAPPEVLYFYGYSTVQNDAREGMPGINLNRIPVVMTSLSITFPEDVDYLPVEISPTSHTEPFPVKLDVNITLVETHSPIEYETFNLDSFKAGKLKSF